MNRKILCIALTATVMASTACKPAESPQSVEPVAVPDSSAPTDAEPIMVDRSNYQKAEVARNFTKWAARGANNKLMHMTTVTPSGPAPTVRMNRDSLYSAAILDIALLIPDATPENFSSTESADFVIGAITIAIPSPKRESAGRK